MSALGQITRIVLLATMCSGIAFADGQRHQNKVDAEAPGDVTLGVPLATQMKLGKTALPQSKFFAPLPSLANIGLLSLGSSLNASVHELADTSALRVAELAPQWSTSVPPVPTNYGEFTLPHLVPDNRPIMPASPGVVPAKWAELQTRFLADEKVLSACRSDFTQCSQVANRFLAIVELGREHKGRGRLGWINRAVNLSIKPMSDWAQYGHADFWASPLQTVGSGAGDCEDYAIAKYAALREAGISPRDLRLLIVQDNLRRTHHAVLAVRDGEEWLILDNRAMAMVTIEEARQYYPLFVMDYRGVRVFSTVASLH